MSQINTGLKAFAANAILASYLRVKELSDASVDLAGPNDEVIGLTDGPAFAVGDNVNVRLRNFPGTRKVVCLSACSIGDRLYGATGGQVDTNAGGGLGTAGGAIGKAEFMATEACLSAGGQVEALPVANGGSTGLLFEATGDSPAITNTAVETAFATNQYTVPANTLKAGDVLRIRGRVVVTGKNAAETLAIKGYLGGLAGVNIFTSGAVNNAAADEIYFDQQVTVRGPIGAANKIVGSGLVVDGTPGTATAKQTSLQSTTLDTTVAELLAISATWSGANAANTAVLRELAVELLRQ